MLFFGLTTYLQGLSPPQKYMYLTFLAIYDFIKVALNMQSLEDFYFFVCGGIVYWKYL